MITILAGPTLQLLVIFGVQILRVDLVRSHIGLVLGTVILHDFPEWRFHFHLLQGLPVEINASEEFVALDVVPGFVA